MSRENYPRHDDGPDLWMAGLFLFVIIALGSGAYAWYHSQRSLKLAQLEAEQAAARAELQTDRMEQAEAAKKAAANQPTEPIVPLSSVESDQPVTALTRMELEAELVRLKYENQKLQLELKRLQEQKPDEH